MITPYSIAQKFIGLKEIPGKDSSPLVMEMLTLDQSWPEGDHVPWCSAFVNYICWLAGVERSKKLNARSWLDVGRSVTIEEAEPGFDIVILRRGNNPAEGHVGFYTSHDEDTVSLLGGNQGDEVCIDFFPIDRILGIRRCQ